MLCTREIILHLILCKNVLKLLLFSAMLRSDQGEDVQKLATSGDSAQAGFPGGTATRADARLGCFRSE
jgi:hypothetical protein